MKNQTLRQGYLLPPFSQEDIWYTIFWQTYRAPTIIACSLTTTGSSHSLTIHIGDVNVRDIPSTHFTPIPSDKYATTLILSLKSTILLGHAVFVELYLNLCFAFVLPVAVDCRCERGCRTNVKAIESFVYDGMAIYIIYLLHSWQFSSTLFCMAVFNHTIF